MIVRLVEGVIAFTVIEVLCLLALHRRTGAGVAPRDFLLNIVSGLCLMGALYCALVGAAPVWLCGWLLGAGLAHGADLRRRWRAPAA